MSTPTQRSCQVKKGASLKLGASGGSRTVFRAGRVTVNMLTGGAEMPGILSRQKGAFLLQLCLPLTSVAASTTEAGLVLCPLGLLAQVLQLQVDRSKLARLLLVMPMAIPFEPVDLKARKQSPKQL